MSGPATLVVRGLSVAGPAGRPILDDVSLTLRAGEVTAIVGETGSGKTTLLNSLLGLLPPGLVVTSGEVRMDEGEAGQVDLLGLSAARLRRYLGLQIGYVPQDARAGLDPLISARSAVQGAAGRRPERVRERAEVALMRAGLDESFLRRDASRRPGRLSGGQCQRVLIAQSIVNKPRVLLLDEPTASLDPEARRAVRATIRSLVGEQCAIGLVTHDLAGLDGLADAVGVMYLGKLVEFGPADAVLRRPLHPYAKGLLGCVLRLDRRAPPDPIPGEIPDGAGAIPGCRFHPRCTLAETRCRSDVPPLREIGPGREVACHVANASS